MNKSEARYVLSNSPSGADASTDPQLREAMEMAASDPELHNIREASVAFDDAFREALNRCPAPQAPVDALAREMAAHAPAANRSLAWLHPTAFAAAAVIILFLALTFTFWTPPETPSGTPPTLASTLPAAPLLKATEELYLNMKPAFRSREGARIAEYLRSHDVLVPTSFPRTLSLDHGIACDVLDVNGNRVSLICFETPDGSGKVHLFSFTREDFPDFPVPESPWMEPSVRSSARAIWADQHSIHVLYSDDGEKNLRQLLDI
jgi:hypothetical protein